MGQIYCLYGTDNYLPQYVGKSLREAGRLSEHLQQAQVGSADVKCAWIRSVFLAGYEIGIFTLEDGIIESALAASETLWMNKFQGLTNRNLYCETSAFDYGEMISGKIKKAVPQITYNFRGYHGVSYSKNKAAFNVRITFGVINGRCCSYLLPSDAAFCSDIEDEQQLWFSNLTKALKTRDQHRRELRENFLFEHCSPSDWDWPRDK